jgi:ABC-type lipoprotein export system ATPase subunit
MKITRIAIKNYRSCANTTFEPHSQLSVLIGPNGSGKTNVLSALRLLPALCAPSHRRYDTVDETATPSEILIDFEVDNSKVTYVAKVNIVTNEKNQDEIVRAEEEWWVPSPSGRRKKIGIASSYLLDLSTARAQGGTWPGAARRDHFVQWLVESRGLNRETTSLLEQVVQSLKRITYYSASQFTNPGGAPVSFEVEGDARKRVGISLIGHKRLLFDIYQEHRQKSQTYNEFIGLVGPDGIGLVQSIDFEEIQTSSSNYSVMTGGKVVRREKTNLLVVPRIKIDGNTLSPSQLSEGTFKTLALVFCLVTDKSAILMIEEPEVCVHHGLLTSIIELIKSYSKEKQIFVSTHSDSVLDKVFIENVFCVRRDVESGTLASSIKKSMSANEIDALKKYLANEGSLGEYWKHGDLEQA